MFAQMLQEEGVICPSSYLPSSHTVKATKKTSWREEASLKKTEIPPCKAHTMHCQISKYEFKNTETYPYLFKISQRW